MAKTDKKSAGKKDSAPKKHASKPASHPAETPATEAELVPDPSAASQPTGQPAESPAVKTEETPAETPAEEVLEQPAYVFSPDNLNETQREAYDRHKNIQWETTEDANIAEAVTHFAFGERTNNHFTLRKHLKGASDKKIAQVKKIAALLGMDSILTDEAIAPLL